MGRTDVFQRQAEGCHEGAHVAETRDEPFWKLNLLAILKHSPGDDQGIVKIWSRVEEEGEGASDGEDYQSNHHGRLSSNLSKSC